MLFRCVVDDEERFQTAIRCACELVKSDSVLQLATDAVTRLSLHNALPYTISLSRLMLKLPNLQVTMYKYIVKHQNSINVMFRLCIVVCHFVEKIESVFRNHNNDLNLKKLLNSCRKSIFLVTNIGPQGFRAIILGLCNNFSITSLNISNNMADTDSSVW